MVLASFNSFQEFSLFAKNMTDVVIWTDYERVNETHFWSPSKKVFIRPKDSPEFGNRQSFKKCLIIGYIIFFDS